jgi:transposase-like protein
MGFQVPNPALDSGLISHEMLRSPAFSQRYRRQRRGTPRRERREGLIRAGPAAVYGIGPRCATRLRRRHGRQRDTWHLDEVFVRIRGKQRCLYRAVDQDGDVIDEFVQNRDDTKAATRCFRKLTRGLGGGTRRLVTDKVKSYPAVHRRVMPGSIRVSDRYANNRAEVSH